MSGPQLPGRGRPTTGSIVLRRRLLLGFWLVCGLGILGRSAELQLVQGAQWRAEADRQHRTSGEIPAARGAILDRSGVPLALSHEAFRVSVAPHEVRDTTGVRELLQGTLELTSAETGRVFSGDRRWVPLAGRYPPAVRDALASTRGVYVERELRRFYPHGDLLRDVLGAVIDEEASGGIEQAYDEHLSGLPGAAVLSRDSEGRLIPGETWTVRAPRSGGQVVLTLDADLQEIAGEALREAMETTGARGGDLLVTDPRSGDILAMVSVRDGAGAHLGGINSPYEPGSTLKPFTVATLLNAGKAGLADSVDTGHGQWRVAGRTITDVSVLGKVDLAHALRSSSNVGIAKVAERLSPAEQYEGLRDFGFGVPTGVPLPGEVGGRLRRPQEWSRQSPASLSIGYEIGVTPLQMAMAYGALANGGVLMEPRLVRAIRDPAGRTVETFGSGSVRRVVSPDVAAEVSRALVGAVEDGTGGRARLETFQVAGKSGTSRAYREDGGYERGEYIASFVGFFPAEDPQLVVFVKLERPQGEYYGGATAAPVTRATMEAVLASHSSPLDRSALAAIAEAQAALHREGAPATSMDRSGGWDAEGATRIEAAPVPSFASLSARGASEGPASGGLVAGVNGGVSVPDLRGLSPRVAVRRLHGMGLVVEWGAPGPIEGTDPPTGSEVLSGDTIRLLASPTGRPPPSSTGGS